MSHWFHRNPLKATGSCNFEFRAVTTTTNSQKICTELRHGRTRLLDIVSNPNNDVNTVKETTDHYFSLITGFIDSLDFEKPGDSKLRHMVKFRWTNTLLGNTTESIQDAVFELCCMLFNVGLWYSKHASRLAAKEEPNMEEAKEVHKCLRVAAGIFTFIKDNFVGRLLDTPEKSTDLDARILSCYIHQCTAEAQEITIARAIELEHKSSIISSLAYETSKMYTDADDSLESLDEIVVGKWRKYLKFKAQIYLAYAYNYHGITLLAEDKCGEAIRCLQESKACYDLSATLAKDYTLTKGAGSTVKPQEHLFFRKLGPIVNRTLERCVRENGFIYHQKVSPEVPALELKATYGLVAPEEVQVPSISPLWTPEAYKGFDISVNLRNNEKDDGKKKEEEIKPVKEEDVTDSGKDPRNTSGCTIS